MRALTIKESLNFERGGDPLDRISIGIGPEKYIPVFEKSLVILGIPFKKFGDKVPKIIIDKCITFTTQKE